MNHPSFKRSQLSCVMLALLPCFVCAQMPEQELKTIKVQDRKNKKAHVERLNRTVLGNEMIQNNRDLVRYSTDVGIADQGRHSKGFAIRGVEDNRVGISIDGVALPDSEENSLYKRYGNLNTSRQSIDPELARVVEVSKGADSFNQGSGNLSGGVHYRTLEASDLVAGEKPWGAMLRSGYTSRNNEWTNTASVAYQGEKFDTVLLYSRRQGHEMESNGDITLPQDNFFTRSRSYSKQTPDDSSHLNHSYLNKLGWQLNENHRVGLSYSGQRSRNYIIEDSAITLYNRTRTAEDKAKRDTVNVFYEYTPASAWLALLKADLDYQKTITQANNYEGRREDTDWRGNIIPAEHSDINIRTFTTDFNRFGLRLDSQPFKLGNTQHTLSVRGALSERDFDVLHQDALWLSGAWKWQKNSTMMHPVKTRHHYVSLSDQIIFNPIFSGSLGIRYDWAKHSQQDLKGVQCYACFKTQDARFKQLTWTLGLNAQLNPHWKLGYNIGTGFRMPNASEMYFDFRNNAAGAWMSNPNLKAEKSLTQNFSVQGKGSYGEMLVNLHHTRYKDFLYEQETWEKYISYGRTSWRPVQQMQNLDTAKVYGLEFNGKLNLHRISPLPEGFKLFGSLGYSKAGLSNGADLLSLQPIKGIVGLDYEQPDGKWGIFSRLTYLGAKKAKDAKYLTATSKETNCRTTFDPWFGPQRTCDISYGTTLDTWKHLNKKALVFDVFGFYKPTKNLTLRAGIYNVFNRKYHTWDALRGLNNTGGVVNSVGKRPDRKYGGYPGLERFYAPGRNFAASIEYKF